jgi:hypothetical protein
LLPDAAAVGKRSSTRPAAGHVSVLSTYVKLLQFCLDQARCQAQQQHVFVVSTCCCNPCPATVQSQLPQQLSSAGPTPFDAVLLSIIRVTDELSLAADGLMELTAAADPSCADGSSSLGYTSTNSSSSFGAVTSGSVRVLPVMQQAPDPAGQQAASPAQEQQQEEASTAYRMSQQALAMASEALKLATLLDGQSDGRDPVEQELLQQIAAAARLVSVMASDIVQPAGFDTDSSIEAVSTLPAAAAAPAPSTAEGVDASVPGGSSSSSSVAGAAGLHNFAGLPVLGLQAQGTTCQVAQVDAAVLQHCLRL